ncbi:MAG: hypothetical protein GQ574_03350 [Crocinitomix sp.]|nr:hypothetical protein [Crocinitomix sp.]
MKVTTLFFSFLQLFACSSSPERSDSSNLDTNQIKVLIDNSINEIISPVFGYRFIIAGDFDGDRIQDTLVEHYISQDNMKETNKFYKNMLEYDDLVDTTIKKQPNSYVLCSNPKIDTLRITDGEQQFGLSFLKNEGDLTGDGKDEISYVINWADWSNTNTWHIMTYRKNAWETLYSFSIWDWQLPSLPETQNQYGLFGLVNKNILDSSDQNIDQINSNFLEFPGLVRKVKTNVIEIIFRNEEAMLDTMQVDLRNKKL